MVRSTECRVLFRPESAALRFLPEGPYALRNGVFCWVAIQHGPAATEGSLNIFDMATGTNRSVPLAGRPGFAFPTQQDGHFAVGLERSFGIVDINTGDWTEVGSQIDGHTDNTIINDGVVFDGNLIFGCKDLTFSTKKAGLYLWRRSDRRLIALRNDQICSNGKAVISDSSGQLRLIDIDSPEKKITSGILDIEHGILSDQKPIVDLTNEDVFPDGMIVTPDGNSLIVALYDPGNPEAGQARQYEIASGQLEAVWNCAGSPRVTCPQLVSHNGKVLLVLTTAIEHMAVEQEQRHPNAGCLFVGETDFPDVGYQPVFEIPVAS